MSHLASDQDWHWTKSCGFKVPIVDSFLVTDESELMGAPISKVWTHSWLRPEGDSKGDI